MGDFDEDDVERDDDGKFAPSGGSTGDAKEKPHPAREAGRKAGKGLLDAAERFKDKAGDAREGAVNAADALIRGDPLDAAKEAGRVAFGGEGGDGTKKHEASAREAGRRHGEAMAEENEDDEGDR
jgi:hypothetical protein